MSDEKRISEDALAKALDEVKKLAGEDLQKGHSSRGTATTKVEAMSGEGGSTQVYHTPSNSDPGTWAGTSQSPEAENGAHDSVEENGTDLKGVSSPVVKSILDLVAKGQLSPAVALELISKAGMAYGKDEDDKDMEKAGEVCPPEDDEDKKMKMGKSLEAAAKENEELNKGFEVSDFLAEMTSEISKAIQRSNEDIKAYVDQRLSKASEKQETFNKSLAGAMSNFSEVVAVQAQRIGQVEQSPARAPKSVSNVQPLNKSFEGASEEVKLTKSQLLNTMTDMVVKGLLDKSAVLKLDSSDQIDPQVYAAVVSHRNGN